MMKNFNKVKVYIDVPYAKKEEAKKLKCKWDPDDKSWYFIYNDDSNFENVNGNIRILLKFEILKIVHSYYEENTPEHTNIINFFKTEKKLIRNKIIECQCGCNYKLKMENKHLSSEDHQKYLNKQDDDYCDF